MWELDYKESWAPENWNFLNCGIGEDSWESLGLQGVIVHPKGNQSWIARCWSWNSNTSAIWCEEPTHLKRPWCRGRLKVIGEGDDRGWDGWLASPSQWPWFLVNSGSWWWTGKSGVLHSMGSQRVGYSWATELHWTVVHISFLLCHFDGWSWTWWSVCTTTCPGNVLWENY